MPAKEPLSIYTVDASVSSLICAVASGANRNTTARDIGRLLGKAVIGIDDAMVGALQAMQVHGAGAEPAETRAHARLARSHIKMMLDPMHSAVERAANMALCSAVYAVATASTPRLHGAWMHAINMFLMAQETLLRRAGLLET